ncbi:MAG: hypothetical protein JSV88_00520, partial [Candidatus Aminicenantes bacterium]
VIGMFVNVIAMRNYPHTDKSFKDFLREVKKNALEAYENQDYPFDELVIDLGLQGDANRNPLFDTVFAFNNKMENYNTKNQGTANSDFKEENYGNEIRFAKFDLYLQANERSETIDMLLRYSTQLFKPSTIQKIAKYYTEILEQVTDNISIQLKDITLSHDFLTAKPTTHKDDGSDFKL